MKSAIDRSILVLGVGLMLTACAAARGVEKANLLTVPTSAEPANEPIGGSAYLTYTPACGATGLPTCSVGNKPNENRTASD